MKLACVASLALLLGVTEAGATVYTLTLPSDPGIDFVTGTITIANGVTGTLSATDITSWNINQSADTVHFQANLNPTNSVVTLTGSALTATTTQLLFNFGGATNSLLEFAPSNFFTGGGGISLQMCDSTGTCLDQNLTQSHSRLMMAFIAPGCCSTSSGVNESGVFQIGAANVTPGVPEPSTWALMLLGFVGLGFAFRQSQHKLSFA